MSADESTRLLAQVVGQLRTLRLPHMRRVAAELLKTARSQRWDPAEALKALLDEEIAGRAASSVNLRRQAAGFPSGRRLTPGTRSCPRSRWGPSAG